MASQAKSQQKKPLDSLKQVLTTNITKQQKVDTYNLIIKKQRDSSQVAHYAQLAIDLAKQIDYNEGLTTAYYNWAWDHMIKGNHQLADRLFRQSLATAQKIAYQKGVGNAYRGLGITSYLQGAYPQSLLNYQQSLLVAQEIDDQKLVSSNYNNLGLLYQKLNNYPQALKYIQQSVSIKEKAGDKRGISSGYNNLGLIYFYQKNYTQALKYYQKSLVLGKEMGDKSGNAISYHNIGSAYHRLGDYTKAFSYLEKGQTLAQQLGDKGTLAFGDQILGELEVSRKQYAKAKTYFLQARKLNQAIGEAPQVALNDIALGEVAYFQKEYMTALDYLKQGINLAKNLKRADVVRDGLEIRAKVHQALGDFKQAYTDYQLFKKTSDSLLNQESIRKLANVELQHTFSKREDSLKQQQNQKIAILSADQERRKANARTMYIGLGLAAVLIVVLLYFYIDKQRNNDKLNRANERLGASNEEIRTANEALQASHAKVAEINKNIKASITYAKRIQSAILPAQEEIEREFPEHFIIYKPRDIVSGDFYWFAKTEPQPVYSTSDDFHEGKVLEGFSNEKKILVVADCTGHGVPGAFMTMLSIQALNNIVIQNNVHEPAQILYQLDVYIKKVLKTQQTQVRDGMDISICVIDEVEQTLTFAGAKNPLIYAQNNQVQVLAGSPYSINGQAKAKQASKFTSYVIDTSIPTTFYMYSDGYQDQFGGPEDRKFMKKRFQAMIREIITLNIQQQKRHLENTLQDWMKDRDQLDDILVLGCRTSATA